MVNQKNFFEDLGVLERQNQVETDIGALDMENEAFKKAQLFSWIFFPIWILLAIIQAVCFLLSNGKLHPLAKILEACDDGNDKDIATRYLLFRFSTLISIEILMRKLQLTVPAVFSMKKMRKRKIVRKK